MEKSIRQIEKNVSASFGYVKKDMLMLNDSFSDLNEKIQHLSMNNAMLLEEIGKLRKEIFNRNEKNSPKKILAKPMSKPSTKKEIIKKLKNQY